jgi:26S proteasome regulatory subunit N7
VQAFLGVIDICRSDMYLHPHTRYYMRELRLVAYNQVGV